MITIKAVFIHMQFQLSSVESLCIPPDARDCRMAQKALKLFQSQKNTDLIFEIILAHGMLHYCVCLIFKPASHLKLLLHLLLYLFALCLLLRYCFVLSEE